MKDRKLFLMFNLTPTPLQGEGSRVLIYDNPETCFNVSIIVLGASFNLKLL